MTRAPIYQHDVTELVDLRQRIADLEQQIATIQAENQDVQSTMADNLRMLWRAIEQLSASVVITDARGVIEYVNPFFCRLTGYSLAEAIGQKPSILKSGFAAPEMYCDLWQKISSGQEWRGQFHNRKKNGELYWEQASIAPVLDDAGSITHYIAVKEDITERKLAEVRLQRANEQLHQSNERLRQRNYEALLFNQMSDMLQACIKVVDAYEIIALSAGQLFDGQAGALYLRRDDDHFLFDAVVGWGDPPPAMPQLQHHVCRALQRQQIALHHAASNGQCIHLAGSEAAAVCVPLMMRGETIGVLHVQRHVPPDIESVQRWQQLAETFARQITLALMNLTLREQLQQQATQDALTGLHNRRYLDETLPRELQRARRQRYPVCLVILDIDHFKYFNDTYGHDAGDTLLRAVGSFLRQNTRGDDVACRYGGEEFILVLPGASLESMRLRTEKIRRGIQALHIQHEGRELGTVTASLGMAIFPDHRHNASDLVRAADAALYHAKRTGRNRVVIADEYHD
jgi:diguanylate cyclase (GGDEF)-like protein/PAS domain S-box-containing protein